MPQLRRVAVDCRCAECFCVGWRWGGCQLRAGYCRNDVGIVLHGNGEQGDITSHGTAALCGERDCTFEVLGKCSTDIKLTEQPGAYKTLCSMIPSGKCGLRRCTLPMPATCVRFPFPNWTAPNVGGDSWALPPQKKCMWPVTDSCAPLSRCHADSSSFK